MERRVEPVRTVPGILLQGEATPSRNYRHAGILEFGAMNQKSYPSVPTREHRSA
jgi:hypothetical protein